MSQHRSVTYGEYCFKLGCVVLKILMVTSDGKIINLYYKCKIFGKIHLSSRILKLKVINSQCVVKCTGSHVLGCFSQIAFACCVRCIAVTYFLSVEIVLVALTMSGTVN